VHDPDDRVELRGGVPGGDEADARVPALARGGIRLAPRLQAVLAGRELRVDLRELRLPADPGDVLVHEAALLAPPVAAEAHPQEVVLDEHALAVDHLVAGRRLLLRHERPYLRGVLPPDVDVVVPADERA